jgi:predicted DCC family thiol-disulfide oxidoreductase YuxK
LREGLLDKPFLVFDGDCGFCVRWVRRWEKETRGRVLYAPYQEAAARFPDIPPERFRKSVQLVETDGRVYEGAEAVFRALAYGPTDRWLRLYRGLPGFAPAAEALYALVASHRAAFSRLERFFGGP